LLFPIVVGIVIVDNLRKEVVERIVMDGRHRLGWGRGNVKDMAVETTGGEGWRLGCGGVERTWARGGRGRIRTDEGVEGGAGGWRELPSVDIGGEDIGKGLGTSNVYHSQISGGVKLGSRQGRDSLAARGPSIFGGRV
jgi:hypothetical protein